MFGSYPKQDVQFFVGLAVAFLAIVLTIVLYFLGPPEDVERTHPLFYHAIVIAIYLLPYLALALLSWMYWTARRHSKWRNVETVTGLDKFIQKLAGSGHHPSELLSKINLKLDFLGNGASKWTSNRDQLENMLERIGRNNGKARFLISNPLSVPDSDDAGAVKRYKRKVARSIRTFCELQRLHKNLEARVYDHIPQFRLTFYDDQLVAVGHYRGPEKKDSSDTPLLIFNLLNCDWSYYKAFESHFEAEWNKATDIGDLDLGELNAVINA